MSIVGSQHVWASQDDWEAHRETISRLYWDECRPLPDVMEIMRSEHNFHATPRMFKFRFKKWGLAKNLKNDQDEEIRVQAASGGNPAVPLIRGRVPGSKKLKRYVHRLAPNSLPESSIGPSRVRSPVCRATGNDGSVSSRVVSAGSTTSSSSSVVTTPRSFYPPSPPPTSVPVLLDAPDSLKFTHQTLRAVLEYTSNRVRKGVWDSSGDLYDSEDHAENWHNKLFQASGMIQRGKFREGFRLLDICYKSYTAQLDAEHPFLIIETYTSVLRLARIEHALAHSLVRYIAGLCRIRLGPGHPLARFWAGLLAMGLPQVRQAIGAVVRVQYDLFDAYFAPGAEFLIVQNVDAARTLHESGCIPLSSAETIIARAIQQRCRPSPDGSPPRPGADDFVCWARLVLALLYIRDGRCDLAAPVIDDVGRQIYAAERKQQQQQQKQPPPPPGEEISLFTQNEYHTMRVHLLRGSGAPSASLAAGLRERFDFCLRTSGPSNHYTTRAFDELDELYRGPAGDVAAAERLRADFDFAVQWDEVCRREEERVAATAGHGLGECRVIGEDVESEDARSDDT
ncbi:hypothetical protein MGN70_000273 [Eutypa lata]|uniref:Clr5 domain-containing protein n=1 Tax=Eutypa lata (strain UCR-EL1) TaxID=1287681 RepID=M7T7X5_EUTLA|nr:hypothetical protein UCREL1_7101 [Eutypa lata UCREL1]KAI1257233.1 hypothetical protein MGN70_000273 [Eutypa lata]